MGLGLAIVRRLAALLEHRIEVASRVGRGSRFSRRRAARGRRRGPRVAGAPPPVAAARPAPASIAGALVGVIDDDPASVDAMAALFATWGAQVVGRRATPTRC